uniref:Odorant receptor n=1 Tax=Romanomermis culicivorax TaxID=13658 RepID=A0A915L2R5_ROMCU
MANKGQGSKVPAPVTIWRTYMVANEWNELQSYRKTSHILQMLTMLLLLKTSSVIKYKQNYPDFLNFIVTEIRTCLSSQVSCLEALTILEPGTTFWRPPVEFRDSRISRFAVTTFLYFLVAFSQWFLNVLIVESALVDHFRNFVDLCSVSNISVLILQQQQFGFYIHGRSVHGYADTNMQEMNDMLKNEKESRCPKRGLENDSDVQTFMVCLPNALRQQMDNCIMQNNMQNITGTDKHEEVANKVKVCNELNKILTSFIEHDSQQHANYMIKDRTMVECLLDMEFQDTSSKGVFYRDPSDSAHTKASIYGNEFTQILFELTLFCAIDLLARDFVLSTVLSYAIVSILKYTPSKTLSIGPSTRHNRNSRIPEANGYQMKIYDIFHS